MAVDTVQQYGEDDGWSSIGDESLASSWSDGLSVSMADEDEDDIESIYRYPYNLNDMKTSSPFKGIVSINGFEVECVFDSGASVSVISRCLADKLGLVPISDHLWLSGFDNEKSDKPAHIVVDVPVKISGCLRPDHMCILDGGDRSEAELCLLGVPWFKAYGIQPRIETAMVEIPTSRGLVYHQGYTENKQGQAVQRKKGKRVNFLDQETVIKTPPSMADSGLPFQKDTAEVFAVGVSVANDAPGCSNSLEVIESYEEDIFEEGLDETVKPNDIPVELREMVEVTFADCFVENSGLGRVKGFEHHVVLKPGATPVRSVPFRLTWEENDFLEKELNNMLELGIIRPSKTGVYSSPCFFVKKKDGTRRMVLDYRKLNQMTVCNAYPLPLIAELLDSLGGARFFTTMDMAFGYWQVPMAQDSIEKTGFVTKKGIFEFLVMPFGLTSAPSTFQAMMNSILGDYVGKFCLVFIDDVLVFGGSTLQEHGEMVEKVLLKCREAGLKLKKKKCSWGQTSVSYLGHEVTAEGLKPSSHNLDKIMAFKTPRNAEVRSYLGLCSYYRAFCPNFASVAAPLQKLVKKNVSFVWGDEQAKSFRVFQEMLVSPPLLAYPDRKKFQVLSVDASNRGLGAVLSQVDDLESMEGEQVVSYASRSVRGPEVNYAITHLEALAVVWGVQHYKHFLLGRRFLLITDHAALRYVFQPAKATPKLTRWAACLMEFDFELRYRPGSQNPVDALSRMAFEGESVASISG
ncbi:hypothetical protein G6F56_005276 [Rhizopus delemar]|nr:hypothetical protein G6F56_005276 [Rhizopus delemar]